MMRFGRSALCALLMAPATAMADEGGFLDILYTPKAEIEINDPDPNGLGHVTFTDGSGFSLRGRMALEGGAFLQGEYWTNDYDTVEDNNGGGSFDFKSEAEQLRGGFGLATESGLYGMAEFIRQEIKLTDACGFFSPCSFDDTGYGLHVGLQGGGQTTHVFAQLGLVDVGDFGNGLEFMIGGAVALGPTASLVADYRQGKQEDDSGVEATLTNLRVGVRIALGG